jgi:glycosyltransferase involved in cell wall biosynthesis
MTTPTVSVIVPAYNAAGFIRRTLESVRAQTLADFEAIIVDDGSRDETAAVVQQMVEAEPRFRLIRQSNGGVAAARNRAIAEARGRFLANLDADDMWLPTFLERTVAALESAGDGATFAFARTLWIDADDRLLPQTDQPPPPAIGYRELLTRNPVGNGSAMLMRTAAVREIGGYDVALVRDFGQAEDWRLLLQLSWRGAVVAVAEPLVLYRILPQSSSHALERSARAALEVIRRCEAEGPPLRRRDYWTSRSLTLLWLARRALRIGRAWLAVALAARAYLCNPLWFTLRELRQPIVNLVRRPFAGPATAGVSAPAA